MAPNLNSKIRILIADDNEITLKATVERLEHSEHFEVVGFARNGLEILNFCSGTV